MKKTLSLLTLCSAIMVAQGDTVKFQLAPSGLSSTNVVPAVTNSTGTGDIISGGIVFQTTNDTLTFAVGYGAAAGFTNLTGQATTISLNGPAEIGSNAPVLIDLSPYTFLANEPTNGGVIFGAVVLTSVQSSNLLAGLDYMVIATGSNTNGEIRAQLLPLATGLTLVCPEDATVECDGQPITLIAQAGSASGGDLTMTWAVNGLSVQTNLLSLSGDTNVVTVELAAGLELGTNRVTVSVSDLSGNQTSCESSIIVQDTVRPVITKATVSTDSLWPPNNKMVPVTVRVTARDACCVADWRIVSVTSNESVGDTAPDWIITGKHGLSLRAERNGRGDGRVYTIRVQAQDCAGNVSRPATLTVTVPRDQGRGDDNDQRNNSGKDSAKGKK